MPMPNAQPVMPAETPLNDMEQFVSAEQPRGLWPRNQNSNFGTLRKVITSPLQDCIDTMNELLDEMFIDTSHGYLGLHEVELGLPRAVTGYSDAHRRATLYSRKARGPFTRTRLRNLIERFILDTFTSGSSTAFDSSGIPITGAGITLYSGVAGPVSTLYRIYENVENFSYEVWIRSDVTPDVAGLTRELTFLTPAGITYTLDNTHAVILDYFRQIRDNDPILYTRMGFTGSGFINVMGGANGTLTGTAPTVASPGLLNSNVVGFANGANNFDGSTGHVAFADFSSSWPYAQMTSQKASFEAWVKPAALPALNSYRMAVVKGNWWLGLIDVAGSPRFGFWTGLGSGIISTISPAINSTYHIVGTYDGITSRLYVNGNLQASQVIGAATLAGPFRIGTWDASQYFFSGVIDEVAYYDRALTPAEVLADYNTGINVA